MEHLRVLRTHMRPGAIGLNSSSIKDVVAKSWSLEAKKALNDNQLFRR